MFKLHGEVLNPYQKPLSLMGKFIKAFTVPGDYIVDVTAGSCTTAVRLQSTLGLLMRLLCDLTLTRECS